MVAATQTKTKKTFRSGSSLFDDPLQFASTFLRVINKQQQLVPLVYKPVQQHWLANRTRRDLILKFRQPGISTAVQAELSRRVWTSTASTATLSHQNSTTQRFRRMVDRFYNNLPEEVRPVRHYNNSTVSTYPDFDSEAIIATAGSEDVGRGFTSSHLHGSEVAFWKNADQIMAGIMQSVPRNGIIMLESTANGAQGWFYERVMEALSGDPTWNLLFYPWWSDPTDPDYFIPLEPGEVLKYEPDEAELVRQHGLTPEQIKFRRAKQRELGWLFPQEYPEDPYSCFITSGQAFFGMLDDAAWHVPDDAIIPPSHRIVAGLDFGQKNDFTVLSILDATTRKQIGLFRWNRMSWEDMRRLIRSECYQHQVSLLVAEENSIGGPNIEELRKEFDAAPGMECAVVAFQTTHASKQMIMGDMHIALHEDGWKLIDTPEQRNEIRIFQSEQLPSGRWRYSAPEGAHDDIVMADAFAIHAARRMRVPEFA